MNRNYQKYALTITILMILIATMIFYLWNTPFSEQSPERHSFTRCRIFFINNSLEHILINSTEPTLYIASMDTVLKNVSIIKIYNPILVVINHDHGSSVQTLINSLGSNMYKLYPETDIDGILYYNDSLRNIIVFVNDLTTDDYTRICILIYNLTRNKFMFTQSNIYGYYLCTDNGIIETYLATETKPLHISSNYIVIGGETNYNYTTTIYLEFIAPRNINKGFIDIHPENGFINNYNYTISNCYTDTCIFETNLKPFRLIDYSDFSEELVKFMFNHESSSNRSYGCARLVIFHNENLTLQYSIHIGDEESSIRLTLSY